MPAPTLLKFLNLAAGVGALSIGGQLASVATDHTRPTTGAASLAGQVPTISVTQGPVAQPEVGDHVIVGLAPSLLRSLHIAPGLPDATPEQNDLAPTLVWQETALPAKATLTIGGNAPAVITDGGQRIFPTAGIAVVVGLAPSLNVPAGQSGTTEPIRSPYELLGREPSLALELTMEIAAPELVGIVGLAPTLSFQIGWEDVPSASGPSWTDVPRV